MMKYNHYNIKNILLMNYCKITNIIFIINKDIILNNINYFSHKNFLKFNYLINLCHNSFSKYFPKIIFRFIAYPLFFFIFEMVSIFFCC